MYTAQRKDSDFATSRKARKARLRRKAKIKDSSDHINTRKFWGILTLIAVLLIAYGIYVYMHRDGWAERRSTAALVGTEEIKASEVNYYTGLFSSYISQEGIFSAGMKKQLADSAKKAAELKEKAKKEGKESDNPLEKMQSISMAERYTSSALNQIHRTHAILAAAKKAQFKTPDSVKDGIETHIKDLDLRATNAKLSFKDITQNLYGRGIRRDLIKRYLTEYNRANAYTQDLIKTYKFSDEELLATYEKRKNDIDTVTFRVLSVPAKIDDSELGLPQDSAPEVVQKALSKLPKEKQEKLQKAAADRAEQKVKEAMAEIKSEADFNQAILKLEPKAKEDLEKNPDASKLTKTKANSGSAYMSEWLFDTERKQGEMKSFRTDQGTTLLYFISRQRPDTETYSSRHILIRAAENDKKALAEAKAKIEELKQQFEKGDKTEESFANLAKTNSQDEGSVNSGGLYSNIAPGEFVKEYEAFCLDPARKVGDLGIVQSKFGYHLIYFLGKDRRVQWQEEAWKILEQDKLNQDIYEMQKALPLKQAAGMKYSLNKGPVDESLIKLKKPGETAE